MLFLLMPFVFGFVLLVASGFAYALARTLLPKARYGIKTAATGRQKFLLILFFLSALGLPGYFFAPKAVASYQRAAFDQTLTRTLVQVARENGGKLANQLEDGSLTEEVLGDLAFGTTWQMGLSKASTEAWRKHGDITYELLRLARVNRKWDDCNAVLTDASVIDNFSGRVPNSLLTEQTISLRGLKASNGRNELNYKPIDFRDAFSQVSLKVLESGSAGRRALYSFVLLHMDDRKMERRDKRFACEWGVEMYRAALEGDDALLANFLSGSLRFGSG